MAKDGGGIAASAPKRQLESPTEADTEEDMDAKRRRILEETRDIDADSEERSDDDSSEEDRLVYGLLNLEYTADRASDDDEDETAELQRELEKIKRERAEKREQEVSQLTLEAFAISYG